MATIANEHVDIDPNLNDIKTMRNFMFWCQHVLPTIYDDSLSYYEVLGKMAFFLNELNENVKDLDDNVNNLFDAFNALQDWVNEHYDDMKEFLESTAEELEQKEQAFEDKLTNRQEQYEQNITNQFTTLQTTVNQYMQTMSQNYSDFLTQANQKLTKAETATSNANAAAADAKAAEGRVDDKLAQLDEALLEAANYVRKNVENVVTEETSIVNGTTGGGIVWGADGELNLQAPKESKIVNLTVNETPGEKAVLRGLADPIGQDDAMTLGYFDNNAIRKNVDNEVNNGTQIRIKNADGGAGYSFSENNNPLIHVNGNDGQPHTLLLAQFGKETGQNNRVTIRYVEDPSGSYEAMNLHYADGHYIKKNVYESGLTARTGYVQYDNDQARIQCGFVFNPEASKASEVVSRGSFFISVNGDLKDLSNPATDPIVYFRDSKTTNPCRVNFADPVYSTNGATKKYVDDADNTRIKKNAYESGLTNLTAFVGKNGDTNSCGFYFDPTATGQTQIYAQRNMALRVNGSKGDQGFVVVQNIKDDSYAPLLCADPTYTNGAVTLNYFTNHAVQPRTTGEGNHCQSGFVLSSELSSTANANFIELWPSSTDATMPGAAIGSTGHLYLYLNTKRKNDNAELIVINHATDGGMPETYARVACGDPVYAYNAVTLQYANAHYATKANSIFNNVPISVRTKNIVLPDYEVQFKTTNGDCYECCVTGDTIPQEMEYAYFLSLFADYDNIEDFSSSGEVIYSDNGNDKISKVMVEKDDYHKTVKFSYFPALSSETDPSTITMRTYLLRKSEEAPAATPVEPAPLTNNEPEIPELKPSDLEPAYDAPSI